MYFLLLLQLGVGRCQISSFRIQPKEFCYQFQDTEVWLNSSISQSKHTKEEMAFCEEKCQSKHGREITLDLGRPFDILCCNIMDKLLMEFGIPFF